MTHAVVQLLLVRVALPVFVRIAAQDTSIGVRFMGRRNFHSCCGGRRIQTAVSDRTQHNDNIHNKMKYQRKIIMNLRQAALTLFAITFAVGILCPVLVDGAQSDKSPKMKPTDVPTYLPTKAPTNHPTLYPTMEPQSSKKQSRKTTSPTAKATTITSQPVATTLLDTDKPSPAPSEAKQTPEPTEGSSLVELASGSELLKATTPSPTLLRTRSPISLPPTDPPTNEPTTEPTELPTKKPTEEPIGLPTKQPTEGPTTSPTERPTEHPTFDPTTHPTPSPTKQPFGTPSSSPSSTASDAPSNVPSMAPSRPPIDFSPRAFRRPDDPPIVRITNVEVSFRGVPLEPLPISERRQLEAVTTRWYNDYYSSQDLPHLQWDVKLSLQKLAEDSLQLLFEISLGSTDMDLVAQPDPSVFLWLPWEDEEANQDYVDRVLTAMPETFDGLVAPMGLPQILTPTVLLPSEGNSGGRISTPGDDLAKVKVGLAVAGILVCMCAVVVGALISRMMCRSGAGAADRPSTRTGGEKGRNGRH